MDCRLVILLLLLLYSCTPHTDSDNTQTYIVTTTGMIADAVKEIVKDKVKVEALMGPGVDPHLYKATQGDLSKLTKSDLIFYNGLHLEGKMGEVLEKLSRQKEVIAITQEIDTSRLQSVPQYSSYDPHVWFDVSLWIEVVNNISKHVVQYDPENANYYKANAETYINQLTLLHVEVKAKINEIPTKQRVLITAHDAFSYFGTAYNIEVKGLQGISTLSEYGLKDVSDLVNFIIDRNIKAVFIETSVSEKAINAVVEGCKSRGFEVKIGGQLYSDAMGADGTPEGTYIGMVRANTKSIVEALK